MGSSMKAWRKGLSNVVAEVMLVLVVLSGFYLFYRFFLNQVGIERTSIVVGTEMGESKAAEQLTLIYSYNVTSPGFNGTVFLVENTGRSNVTVEKVFSEGSDFTGEATITQYGSSGNTRVLVPLHFYLIVVPSQVGSVTLVTSSSNILVV